MFINSRIAKTKAWKVEALAFALMLLIRLPSLGRDNFNTDVWKWKARTYNFLNSVSALDLKGTYQSYHPGVTLMVLGGLGVKTYNAYHKVVLGIQPPDNTETIFGIHFLQKFFVVLVTSLVLAYCFSLLKSTFGVTLASFTMVLLNTEPFFLAHTREFHLEGLVSVFGFASVLSVFEFLKSSSLDNPDLLKFYLRNKYLLASSLLVALAGLTKSSGLFFFGFNSLILLAAVIRKAISFNKLLAYIVFSLLFFFLLWPALWVSPMETLGNYYRGIAEVGVEGDHIQLYFGKLVLDPGPSFYPLNVLLRFTPEAFILLLLSVPFLLRKASEDEKALLGISYLFTLLYVLVLTLASKKLDRYLIPVFPFVSLIASWALISFLTLLDTKVTFRFLSVKATALFIALLLFVRISVAIYIHPNYLFYYSPLVGGAKNAIFMVEPKWAFAGSELGWYFKNLSYREETAVALPEKYYTQLWPFVPGKSYIMDIERDAKKANFFVFPVWDDRVENFKNYDLSSLGQISFRGVRIYNVYKRTI